MLPATLISPEQSVVTVMHAATAPAEEVAY